MADITPLFNSALKSHDSPPVNSSKINLQNIENFLKEAYRINAHISSLTVYLRSIRQSYLSTTKPPRLNSLRAQDPSSKWQYLTNRQRDEIDAETKRILRELNASIRNLADAEQLRQNTQASLARKRFGRGLGALGSWAAGGMEGVIGKSEEQRLQEAREATIKMHREGVLWYLRDRLQIAGKAQAGMMERRLGREVEMGKSLLGRSESSGLNAEASTLDRNSKSPQNFRGNDAVQMEMTEKRGEENRSWEQELSPEQVQIFEKENRDMIKHYQYTLSQVKTAESSLLEISELQTQLVNNLTIQSEHISQLQADSELTVENVDEGNKHLKKASERGSTARWVFYASCGLSAVLVIWDLVI